MPKLIIEFQGQEWAADLREGVNLLGRGASCTIPIKDPQLSREHCEIRVSGAVATLHDKGSMNGTVVNGNRIQEHRLQPGDKIVFGHVTAWFEIKKGPEGGPAAGTADPRAHTRRAVSAEAAAVAGLPPDYTLGGRAAFPWRKLGAGAAVLGLLGVAAFLLREVGTPRAVEKEDKDNLIRRNASFELQDEGKPLAWTLRGSAKGSLSVAPQGKRGSCLVVEKAAGGAELVLECAYAEEFALGRAGGVEASAWVRYDGFSGAAAIKVDWLKAVNGAVLAEDISEPAPRGSGWAQLQASFSPPADAGAFRLALAAVGRSGRVAFDDVSLRLKPPGAAGREYRLGSHRVAPARDGTLRIETRGRRSLVNFHARIESTREGAIPQSVARGVSVTSEPDRLVFKGRMMGPGDFREIEFEELVAHKDGETVVQYRFPGGGLRQADRVSLVFTALRVDRIQGVPEGGDKTANRISFRSEDGEVVVEYSDPVRIRVEQARGGLRLVQSFAVDPSDPDDLFALKIREAAIGGGNPVQKAKSLMIAKRFGEALGLLREEIGKTKDPALRDQIEGEIRRLEETERGEWAEVQVAAFQATLSRRTDLFEAAMEALDGYLQRWTGEAFSAKAEAVREKCRESQAAAASAEAARQKLVLERAKQYAAEGRRTLAASLARLLAARPPGGAAVDEAREFLKTLSESQ